MVVHGNCDKHSFCCFVSSMHIHNPRWEPDTANPSMLKTPWCDTSVLGTFSLVVHNCTTCSLSPFCARSPKQTCSICCLAALLRHSLQKYIAHLDATARHWFHSRMQPISATCTCMIEANGSQANVVSADHRQESKLHICMRCR